MDDGEYPAAPASGSGLPPVVIYPATDPGDANMLPVERPPLILGPAPELASGGSNRRRTVGIAVAGVAVVTVAVVTTVVFSGNSKSAKTRTALSTQQSEQPISGASFPDGSTSPQPPTSSAPASASQASSSSIGAVAVPVPGSSNADSQPSNTHSSAPAPANGPAPSTAPASAPQSTAPAPPPPPPTPAYAGRLVSSAAASSTSSLSFHPSRSAAAGDTLVLAVMLTNTHSGSVSASDSEGDAYRVVVDQTDGKGDRTLLLAAPGIRALSTGDTVNLSFPTTGEYHVALDAFSGVTTIDGHSAATGAAGTLFDSGAASLSGRGIVYGVAGVQGGTDASWTSGLGALPTLFVSEDQLATAYLVTSSSGGYQAGGGCQHQWMAGVVTLS